MRILVLNGPNINMLGIREPGIYGNGTYKDLEELIKKYALEIGVEVDIRQTNHEGTLVEYIQSALDGFDGIKICASRLQDKNLLHHLKPFEIANEKGISTLANMIITGKLLKEVPMLGFDNIDAPLNKVVSARKQNLLEVNKTALKLGYDY